MKKPQDKSPADTPPEMDSLFTGPPEAQQKVREALLERFLATKPLKKK